VPYFTAIGDHDLLRPGLRGEGYVKRFGPTYYRFAFGNSCFVVLDNSAGYVSRGQVDWLRASLRSMAAYPNKFVLAHQPPFDPRRGERHAMKPLIAGAEVVMSLAAKARVAAFFAGHIHSFVETRRGGVPYVITGGGGGDLKAPFPRYHYVAVTVDGDEARWRVRLVEP
jgi:3',5'-cyclic AMP phosphodiesterase CpdA